ncbi:hypothetical protein AVEN_158860-1 [Araneus ventricosus]|uniref:Uncharacterized protein n=1 Tax=Araneus ventricosus TaxID=182803 RepID=A0A4Y2E8E3_ARAVE|nr:hypothetical protein AVEN_158860-1 [Araneus ventricosus]
MNSFSFLNFTVEKSDKLQAVEEYVINISNFCTLEDVKILQRVFCTSSKESKLYSAADSESVLGGLVVPEDTIKGAKTVIIVKNDIRRNDKISWHYYSKKEYSQIAILVCSKLATNLS